jgi:predicted enzyme related to lactoylglutathione lyase
MAYLHGKFVWFEHVSNDVEKSRAFYGGLFGWKSGGVPVGDQTYHMIQNETEGIGGFRTAMPGVPNHWMCYLSVADVDATVESARAAGAQVLMPPTDFGSIGRGATIADPTGARLSVWRSAEGDRPDRETVAAGDWYWNECWTPDAAAALAFYERVFGYTHDSMDMGPQGTYYVLMKDGVARGGLMGSTDPNAQPAWLPYVSVADCDATAKRAAWLGSQNIVPPMDIPDVGRFAVLMDPVGAVIGVIRGKFTG